MGFSPSAHVYYGFDLGDMTDQETGDSLKPAWMGDDKEWEEVLAEKFGWSAAPYPEHIQNLPREQRHETPEYKAWSARRSLIYQQAKAYGVVLDTYGYFADYDGMSHYVATTASVQSVGDYGSVELEPLVVVGDWDAKLIEFMKLMELPILAGASPAWHLNCSYG